MHRVILATVAAFSIAISTGCSMCESCFDYTYPAYGGLYCWDADDCCRAGSAFCHVTYGSHSEPGGNIDEIHDPVPDVPAPTPAEEIPELPPGTGEQPPTDLTPAEEPPTLPPFEIPDTGAPPVDDLDLPPLNALEELGQ